MGQQKCSTTTAKSVVLLLPKVAGVAGKIALFSGNSSPAVVNMSQLYVGSAGLLWAEFTVQKVFYSSCLYLFYMHGQCTQTTPLN